MSRTPENLLTTLAVTATSQIECSSSEIRQSVSGQQVALTAPHTESVNISKHYAVVSQPASELALSVWGLMGDISTVSLQLLKIPNSHLAVLTKIPRSHDPRQEVPE